MTPIDELKSQLAQLDALIKDGVLSGDAARQARDRLEAQLLAAVLTPDAAPAAAPGAGPSRRLMASVLGFVLLFGAAGYAWRGNLAGLDVTPGSPPSAAGAAAPHALDSAQFEAMAQRLAQRLAAQPDDAEGWAMLGRSYSVLGKPALALQAYQRVQALRPQDAQALADVADAMASTRDRQLAGEPAALVQRALQLDPNNPKALALAGTLAFDQGDAALAARHWEQALKGMDPATPMARQLQGALDDARQRAGAVAQAPQSQASGAAVALATSPPAAAPAPGSASLAAAGAAVIEVRVSLAPALAALAAPQDTVFIFARAVQGGRAPLAIQRRQVKDLPLTLTLDDSMAMSPASRLSGASTVLVGARVSKSGDALPHGGDLQALSAPVAVGSRDVRLEIAEVLH